jgi:hypothetical protein
MSNSDVILERNKIFKVGTGLPTFKGPNYFSEKRITTFLLFAANVVKNKSVDNKI